MRARFYSTFGLKESVDLTKPGKLTSQAWLIFFFSSFIKRNTYLSSKITSKNEHADEFLIFYSFQQRNCISSRAWELHNFFGAPAPDLFQAAPALDFPGAAPAPDCFFSSGSGSFTGTDSDFWLSLE